MERDWELEIMFYDGEILVAAKLTISGCSHPHITMAGVQQGAFINYGWGWQVA